MSSLLEQAYSSSTFRELGHQLVDQLADYLEAAEKGHQAVIPQIDPQNELRFWEKDLVEGPRDPVYFFEQLINRSIHLHQQKYMGHQIAPPAYLGPLAALAGDLLNNGMAVFEMGAASTAIEQVVVQEVCKVMGYDELAGGFLTSGGTLANLTALLAARQAIGERDVWTEGQQEKLAIMVSEESHYCVDRAVRIMGWGEQGIIKVPVNAQYQLRTDLLEEGLRKAEAAGRKVIALVGCACSTSTGAYDDLEAMADFCAQHQLWFHVDGAHGAAAAFSSRYRPLVKGIGRADSIAMDFHKMLMTPALATALLFKKGQQAFGTFAQRAQYLWASQSEQEWHNLAKRTFECTKYMMSIKVYILLRSYGLTVFDEYVNRLYDMGRHFAQLIQQRPHFELAVTPQSNIVCFRYTPPNCSPEQLDLLNSRIRKNIIEEGEFYIVQTQLKQGLYLRTTLMNPFTTEQELLGLLDKVEALAR
ncbi:MAG: aminotransferase class I/II-fold pyridoxal phosphate-dependent enzyme [Bacteroidota bacterium]